METQAERFSLSELSARLGRSAFEGSLKKRVEKNRVHYDAALSAGTIDALELARLIPEVDAQRWLPADFDADLSLEVDKLIAADRELSAVELSVSLENSRLTVAPFSLVIAGKPVSGELSIDERVSPARTGLRLEAENVDKTLLATLGFQAEPWDFTAARLALDAHTIGRALPAALDQLSLRAQALGASIKYTHESMSTMANSMALELSTRPGESLVLSAEGIHENFPVKLDLSIDDAAALYANQPIAISATTMSSHTSLGITGNISSPRELDGVALRIVSHGSRFEILHPSLWLPWEQTGEFRLETDLEHTNHQLKLRNLDIEAAGNDLSGTIVIPTDAEGRIDVQLESASIAIGDVLEPNGSEDVTPVGNPYIIPSFPLARVLPTPWNGDFVWRIDWLQVDDSVFKDVTAEGRLEDGQLRLSQSAVTHPNNGPFALTLTIDPSVNPPAALKVAAEEFDLGWILPNEEDAQAHWPTDIHIELSGPADTFQQLMGDADGVIEFSAGQTEGAEFEKWDLNLLPRMLPALGPKAMDQINCMVVHMDVEDGVATGEGAVMETRHAIVAGGGAVDLRTEHLGLVLSAQPKDKTLLDLTASLRVGGTLRYPEVDVVSVDVAFGATQILLGVANPFSLLGSFVLSSSDDANTACEAALKMAAEKGGANTAPGQSTTQGGLFDFLFGREGSQ